MMLLASELIKKLQESIEKHGDLPVYHWDDWAAFTVEEVNFTEEYKQKDWYTPPYFLLGQDTHGFGERLDGTVE